MKFPQATYDHCVITGASSGIGDAFARALAPRARALTLVARREDRLRMLAGELERDFGISCAVLAQDLATEQGVMLTLAALRNRERPPVDLLVNNAGFGRQGAFEKFPWPDYQAMIQLNCITVAALVHGLLDDLTARPGRGVINVASTAGYQPVPRFVVYSATKAFVRSFSNGLSGELNPRGVRMLSFCPGPVATEFGAVAQADWSSGRFKHEADEVVEMALRAYAKGRREVIAGTLNAALALLAQHAPLGLVIPIAFRLARSKEGKTA